MKTIAIITMLTLASHVLAQSTIGPVTPLSPEIIDPVNGYTYLLLSQGDWTDSEAEAEALGGHLATIDNQAEEDWIYGIFSGYGGQLHALWTGLNDLASPSNFVWASGAPVTYTDWADGQPYNAIQPADYAAMYHTEHIGSAASEWTAWGDLNTTLVGEPFNGVVEVVPEPSIMSLLIVGLVTIVLFVRGRRFRSNLHQSHMI
jgi:hypothetical protein